MSLRLAARGVQPAPWPAADRSRRGGRWFEPFIDKLNHNESFTIETLERAHPQATGKALKLDATQL